MIRGIYTLTSSMLTRNKELAVISNNMANINTQGFKSDKLVTSSKFSEILNIAENGKEASMGNISLVVGADDTKVSFTQGSLKSTGRELDFALAGPGFFEIRTPQGMVYTRNGSFTIDDQGYLTLQGVGRVQGQDGDIRIHTNNFTADDSGTLSILGISVDKIAVKDFHNYDSVVKNSDGMFTAKEGANIFDVNQNIVAWQTLEASNVNMVDEMTSMMSSQRTIQSCSQFIKISDQLIGKLISEVGSV